MRILHLMAGAREGGAENIMLESVLALAEAGVAQAVVTRPDNAFRIDRLREAGVAVRTAGFTKAWPFPTQAAIARAMAAWVGKGQALVKPAVRTATPASRSRSIRNALSGRVTTACATPASARARTDSSMMFSAPPSRAPAIR